MASEKDNARKYVIRQLPDKAFLAPAVVRESFVGYLKMTPEHEVKVAHYPLQNESILTEKRGTGDAREKSPIVISKEAFDALYPLADKRVNKRCYILSQDGHELRFDEFLAPTSLGLILMLEVKSPEFLGFIFPNEPWVQDIVEVTSDPRYLGQNLAV